MIRFLPSVETIKNRGEAIVARHLQQAFKNKNYIALHSLGLAEHGTKVYGEADIVLISDRGIATLEVKGGSVERKDGIWTIGNSYQSSDGPFEQAKNACYAIRNKLLKADKRRAGKFPMVWGAVFSDVDLEIEDPAWSEHQVCGVTKLNSSIENFVVELFEKEVEKFQAVQNLSFSNPINKADIEWACRVLRPDISEFSLLDISSSQNELLFLEEIQRAVIEALQSDDSKRHLVKGGPGTGKTFLIQEWATIAPNDKKILVLCYNRNLASHLKQNLIGSKNVSVGSYYSFIRSLIGAKEYDHFLQEFGAENFYSDKVHQLFEEYVCSANELEKFDWILVDEAQDLPTESLKNLIDFLCVGGIEQGKYMICFDDNVQSEIYKKSQHDIKSYFSRDARPSTLRTNYRNPRAIAKRAYKLFDIQEVNIKRDYSSPPKLRTVEHDVDNDFLALEKLVCELINEKNVKPFQITILTFKGENASELSSKKQIAGNRLENLGRLKIDQVENTVGWSSIPAYKGLENEVIILFECPDSELSTWLKSALYVALTRTKTLLYIVAHEDGAVWECVK